MSLTLIHIAACVRIPFLFKAELYSTLSTPTMFIRPSRDRQVASTFLLLQIMLNVSMKTSVQVPPFSSLGYMPRSRTAEHVTIPCLVSLRNPTYHFPQQLSSLTCHTSNAQGLQLLHLLNRYDSQRVCSSTLPFEVLICTSLQTGDSKHLLVCLWSFTYLLWRNTYSSPWPIFE